MASFEQKKNTQALIYTTLVCGCLAALFLMLSWTNPVPAEPKEEEGMEVNLGNSETGIGEIQSMIPGESSAITNEANPLPEANTEDKIEEKDVETNDADKEAPTVVVKKTPEKIIPKKEIKPIPPNPKPTTKPEQKPVEVPPSPKPKIIYNGVGNQGSGQGNNADSYQAGNNQGIAGGKGDQGKPNGNPYSDSYIGNGGSGNGSGSGLTIARGLVGRKLSRLPSFEDEFSENGKVAVDIKVDANGNVTGVNFQPKGSTTTNSTMKAIALQKARQLKFTPDEDGGVDQMGTIIFNFKIKN